jgi:signal transduction histidine kinase
MPLRPRASNGASGARSALAIGVAVGGARALALCALGVLLVAAALAQGRPPRVLVLVQEQQYLPAAQMLGSGLPEALAADARGPLMYVEHLDLTRLSDPAKRREQFGWLASKYGDARFDVVVAIGPEVLRILAQERPGFVGESPVVSWSFSTAAAEPGTLEARVLSESDPERTLALARKLLPDTSRVIVVSGDSALDDIITTPLPQRADAGVRLEFVRGEPLPVLERRVAALERGSVVLFTSMVRDREGRNYAPAAVASVLARRSAVPVFVTMETTFVDGTAGGELVPFRAAGSEIGAIVRRLLAGDRGALGAAPRLVPLRRVVDEQVLRRFGVARTRVPPGFGLTNSGEWSPQARRSLAIAIAIVLAQALTIGALLLARRRRMRAEAELAARARFYSIMAGASASLTRLADAEVAGGVPEWLERVADACGAERVTRYRLAEPGRGLQACEDWPSMEGPPRFIALDTQDLTELTAGRTVIRAAAAGPFEVLVPASAGGRVTDVLGVTLQPPPPRELPVGRLRMLGEVLANALARARNAADLRERLRELESSRAEQRRLAGYLIGAQESERRRVARELHDDVSQRLSLIGMQLWTSASGAGPASDLGRIAESVGELASDVSRLSHRLHPDLLHRIGLAAALRGLCRDASESGRLVVECHAEPAPAEPSTDMALTAYRVAQEALRNVRKHSGASRAFVRMGFGSQGLELEIRDEGKGFDPAIAGWQGLGLTSMRERAEMLGGSLEVASRPGDGASVRLTLPLTAAEASPPGAVLPSRPVEAT